MVLKAAESRLTNLSHLKENRQVTIQNHGEIQILGGDLEIQMLGDIQLGPEQLRPPQPQASRWP